MSELTIVAEKNVAVPMRDGVVLRADVYRPAAAGTYPVLLQRTPYNKNLNVISTMLLDVMRAASEGYVVVIQDSRGRYASEGEFYPFRDDLRDGYDTVEWCAVQSWSNGNVGMYGASYVGVTQWLATIAQPPHLKAIFPLITASHYHEGWAYQGGAFALGFNESWAMTFLAPDTLQRLMRTKPEAGERLAALMQGVDDMCQWFRHLPLKDFPFFQDVAPYFYDWLVHPDDDDYWAQWNIERHYTKIRIPAYNLGGWYDIFLGGTLRNYSGMREHGATPEARQGQRLIIGPWQHAWPPNNVVGEVNYGLSSTALAVDIDGLQLKWFDYWLKGKQNGVLEEPPVRLFVMGENRWRSENEWPLARTQYTKYYLHSGGQANSLNGDGSLSPQPPRSEPADVYVSDPRNPVPTKGGGLCCWPAELPGGAHDQRTTEARTDVLVYTTAVLERQVEVTGPVTLLLFAATSAVDTDFTGKLVDVHPDGFARNRLRDGSAADRSRSAPGRSRRSRKSTPAWSPRRPQA